MNKNLLSHTLKAGLVVGTLDILAAFIHFYILTHKNPLVILKFISSGVFGADAFTAGNKMIVYGLVFHYLIAILFSLFFFLIYPKLKSFIKNLYIIAIIYSLFIWASMQFIVLPLSQASAMELTLQGSLIAISILIVCIGIPLSFLASKYSRNQL
jgi:hypothetical protein